MPKTETSPQDFSKMAKMRRGKSTSRAFQTAPANYNDKGKGEWTNRQGKIVGYSKEEDMPMKSAPNEMEREKSKSMKLMNSKMSPMMKAAKAKRMKMMEGK